ncbi:beta-1,3-n-acetylglucosaminyltransferase,putati ve [Schistosoma mansoni]|nr:beta-1,3-n-acetylglucosaminyltransferase,putati ve [Schistosoma mansoni]|eukprot:XP_018655156.1 beta-1,3-n-acetylglucosaminyltransferase,putati ve [Schistosoma mansoni]
MITNLKLPLIKLIKYWKFIFILIGLLFNLYLYIYILNKEDHIVYQSKSSILCFNDIFTQIVSSQSSWLTFIDALNKLHVNDSNHIETTEVSTELFHFTYYSLPIINETIKVLNFKNQLKLLSEPTNIIYHFNEIYTETINNKSVSYTKDNKSIGGRHYPKYFNMTEYLNAMSDGFPPNEVPINNEHLFVVETPRSACDPCHEKQKLSLVVLIKSCIYCYEQRSYARKTYMNISLWNNLTVRFVFVVGLPIPNETNIHHFDGVNIQLDGKSWWESRKRELSRWSVIKELRNESKFYGDMLVGGFFDTYFNLTTKMMLSFRWACVFCKNITPLLLFIDDDYVLHPNNTIKLVRSIKVSDMKSYIGGPIHSTSVVSRPQNKTYNSKWDVSPHEYPYSYYPPYFYGIGYIIGADVVCDASVTMSFTQNLRIDDAYLGIVLARLNKKLNQLKGFRVQTDTNFESSGAIIIQRSSAGLLFT